MSAPRLGDKLDFDYFQLIKLHLYLGSSYSSFHIHFVYVILSYHPIQIIYPSYLSSINNHPKTQSVINCLSIFHPVFGHQA